MKSLLFLTTILAFVLSACGAKATPTIDPALLQASAVAAANTMVALTQAAVPPTEVPTDTPQPSPTPLPTPTELAIPSLPSSGFPTASQPTYAVPTAPSNSSGSTNPSGDPCNAPLPANPSGPKVGRISVVNNSGAQANGSIYLAKNKFGQCGYRGYSLVKNAAASYTDLTQGCYTLYAWINDPKKPTTVFGSGCVQSLNSATFVITNSSITLH